MWDTGVISMNTGLAIFLTQLCSCPSYVTLSHFPDTRNQGIHQYVCLWSCMLMWIPPQASLKVPLLRSWLRLRIQSGPKNTEQRKVELFSNGGIVLALPIHDLISQSSKPAFKLSVIFISLPCFQVE